MNRMLARNAQTLRQRFFLRRRISTLACSALSIRMIPASCNWATNRVRSSIEIVCGRYFRSNAFLTSWRVCLPSNCSSRKYSSILKRKYLSASGSLIDVVRHPLVELRLDDQVGPQLDTQVFGGLPERQCGGQGGSGAHGRQPFGSRAEQMPTIRSRRSAPVGPLRRTPIVSFTGCAPSASVRRRRGRPPRLPGSGRWSSATIKPGRSSPAGFSNSARIRTAVSATGWIWGSTNVILPRNRFFSIGKGSRLVRA